MITGTSTTDSATVAVASICIPPWPGGELLKQSPCIPPPKGLHGHDCKSVPGSRRGDIRRHFHQLICRLRRTEDCASTPWWTQDLGNFDNLLGQRLVEDLQDTHQLFHLLRLDHEEQRDHRNRVGDLLRGVSLDPAPAAGAPRAEPTASPSQTPLPRRSSARSTRRLRSSGPVGRRSQ